MVLPVSLDELLATRSAMIVKTDVRAAFTGFARYRLYDRGSYEWLEVPADDRLGQIVETFCGERKRCVASRVLRLVPGDYVLARHDPVRERGTIEVVVDLSPAAVEGAEVQYRQHGQVFFRMPCEPGTAAVVPCGPTVTSNHSYVSKLRTGGEVVRWIAVFA
jgi:hypothetical protein